MKTAFNHFSILLLGAALAWPAVSAETNKSIQRVFFKDGQITALVEGKTVEVTNDFTLPGNITVMTNGTFSVRGGKERPFRNGDALGADGMLMSADGVIVPAFDHITMKNGRPTLVKDGESSPLTREYLLGDKTRILADGTVVAPNGLRSRMLDGQIYKLDGTTQATKDSVVLQGGKVLVQKDGSPLTLRPDQTITMADGTKVFGNGTVIKADGTRLTLKEGEILTVEGVAPRKR